MTLDAALLEILCCPVTRLPLQWLSGPELEQLNRMITERKIRDRGGALVEEPLEQALATRDGKLAYPVRDGVPVLLEDAGIALTQLGER